MRTFKVGDKVIPNLENWRPSEFDFYIKPKESPIGVIVDLDMDDFVDVRWPGGLYYQNIDEIELYDG